MADFVDMTAQTPMKLLCILLSSLIALSCLRDTHALVNFTSTVVPITDLFNNQAASINGSSANFDGLGSSYDAQFLPEGSWTYEGITYSLPAWGSMSDNVLSDGQVISLQNSTYVHEMHIIYAGDGSSNAFEASFNLTFEDNTIQSAQLVGKDWWSWPIINTGIIQTPYHFLNQTTIKDWNMSQIYQWSTSVFSQSPLQSITLPQNTSTSSRFHLFALSITPSVSGASQTAGPALSVRSAAFTSRWEEINGTRAQAVQVTLANLLPTSVFNMNTSVTSPLQISITGSGISTLSPGVINRLVPGDQVRVDVFVTGSTNNTQATITIKDSQGNVIGTSDGWPVTPLRETWEADAQILSTHETPTWWNQAKYGIFIHWGVYSYPAWAPPGQYAEWYDWDLHVPGGPDDPTWAHHLQTYGPNVIYDDFIPYFNASKFNASAWLDLFDSAGAKYFVQVTKHHDGFGLFDTGNTTHRSSVYLGPKRDLLAELFETAKQEKPNLHRGTYYSLPEWYSPDFARYGFGEWPGGLAHNAFNASELESPYTGRLNITDYLTDLQLPQMLDLAQKYDTEIMWCDIGGPNKTLDFAAAFYNNAAAKGYQVTMNNRCGAVPDFDTPEYATYGSIQTRSWETSEGMDPFSYGLNSATNASQYKNATTILQTLVDIVSKNGNYLLDVGPTAEGEIIAPMADNLLDAGKWLAYAGDCVYSTEYRFQGPQNTNADDTPVRFLTTPTTFCIVALSKPTDGQLVVNDRLPILQGDEIVLLGPANTSNLPWSVDQSTGQLVVNVSQSYLDAVDYAWAFQVRYKIGN